MSKLLLIDADNVGHRSCYSNKDLYTDDGRFIGGIAGTIGALRSLCFSYPDHTPIVIWDSRSKGRRRLFPAYKANRPTDDFRIEIDRQLAISRRVSRLLGFRTVFVPGFEADDLIASLATRNPCTIVSNDKDFFQLLRHDHVRIDRRDSPKALDRAAFVDRYGVSPDHYRLSQAITGDSSDGVIGVYGVGEIKAGKNGEARKLIGDLDRSLIGVDPDWLGILEHIAAKPGRIADRVVEAFDQVCFNYQLTELLSDRFAPLPARQAMRTQIEGGYTGVAIRKAIETLIDVGYEPIDGIETQSFLSAAEARLDDIERIDYGEET